MKPGLGTQLRHLIELLDGAVSKAYDDAGLNYRPRFTPVMRALIALEPSTIGQIAQVAGLTQPAATQTVALMIKQGLVSAQAGPVDARQRLIYLTDEGRAMLPRLRTCWRATEIAAASLDAALPRSLSQSLSEAIAALEGKSFDARITEARARMQREEKLAAGPRPRRDAAGASAAPKKKVRVRST